LISGTDKGVVVGGVHYCSCYDAGSTGGSSGGSSGGTTGSNMFAIGFSLLAILASLWK